MDPILNNDGARDPHGEKPFGRVERVNLDGSVVVSINMDNPAAVSVAVLGLAIGPAAANAELRRQQEAGRN